MMHYIVLNQCTVCHCH